MDARRNIPSKRAAFAGASLMLAAISGCNHAPEGSKPNLPMVEIEPAYDSKSMAQKAAPDQPSKGRPLLNYGPPHSTCHGYVIGSAKGEELRRNLGLQLKGHSSKLRKSLGSGSSPIEIEVQVDFDYGGAPSVRSTMTTCGSKPCPYSANPIEIANLHFVTFPTSPFPSARECTIAFPYVILP